MEREKYYKKPKPTNRHHIIGQSQRYLFNVFDKRNVIRMDMRQHSCLHGLYKNLLTPKEQIKFMMDLCEPVLSKKAYLALSKILSMDDKEFYDNGLVKNYKKYSTKK